MERYNINADEAFLMLVVAGQSTNIRLVDVAGQLIRTGLLASREPHPCPPSGPNGRTSASPAAPSEAATAE